MENLLIRKLKDTDADDISKTHSAITMMPIKGDFKRMVIDQARKEEDASFVAAIDEEVVGFLISYILAGGFGIEKSAWLPQVGVHPKCTGQGIGKALADFAFKYHREQGIKNVYTSVRWYDTDVLSFFKTLGFDRSEFINLRKGVDQ